MNVKELTAKLQNLMDEGKISIGTEIMLWVEGTPEPLESVIVNREVLHLSSEPQW